MNRWAHFSLEELLALEIQPRNDDLQKELNREITRRYAEQDETNVADGYLQAAVEAARMADAGETSEGVFARRAETKALRNAVWAIIQYLQERP